MPEWYHELRIQPIVASQSEYLKRLRQAIGMTGVSFV
jgi:hypothetical protein